MRHRLPTWCHWIGPAVLCIVLGGCGGDQLHAGSGGAATDHPVLATTPMPAESPAHGGKPTSPLAVRLTHTLLATPASALRLDVHLLVHGRDAPHTTVSFDLPPGVVAITGPLTTQLDLVANTPHTVTLDVQITEPGDYTLRSRVAYRSTTGDVSFGGLNELDFTRLADGTVERFTPIYPPCPPGPMPIEDAPPIWESCR
jgi:hypothetical protein